MGESQERESRLSYKEDVYEPAAYFRKNSMLHVEQSL